MGQRDQVECATVTTQREGAAYDLVELLEAKKLRNRELPDRDDESWLQKIDFIIHPCRAISDLVRSWNAVAACGGFSGETAANGSKVDLSAHLHFTQMTGFLEPTKEGVASRPGEGLSQNRFP